MKVHGVQGLSCCGTGIQQLAELFRGGNQGGAGGLQGFRALGFQGFSFSGSGLSLRPLLLFPLSPARTSLERGSVAGRFQIANQGAGDLGAG